MLLTGEGDRINFGRVGAAELVRARSAGEDVGVDIAAVPDASLEMLSKIVGDHLTGSRITQVLDACALPQPEPTTGTKWRRIYAALSAEQGRSQSGACVVRLVHEVGAPQRWSTKPEFDALRDELNQALAFCGLVLYSDGRVGERAAATTHEQAAAATARRLQDELVRRGGHMEIFLFCSAELLAEDCFNAVFEATKGLAQRLRDLTMLDLDATNWSMPHCWARTPCSR